jgi:hypothetical protein
MTIEQFVRRSRMIAENLDHILVQREKLKWVGAAGLANPHFRQVCAAQERLLNAMEEMLDVAAR